MKQVYNNNSRNKRLRVHIANVQHFQQELWNNFQSELFTKDKDDTFEFFDNTWRKYCAKRRHDCVLTLDTDWFKNLAIQ